MGDALARQELEKAMIEIELEPLGIVCYGDPATIWHKVSHSPQMPAHRLAYNLAHLWAPKPPAGAVGQAISVRFS